MIPLYLQKVGQFANKKYEVLVEEENIAWPGGAKAAPPAEPECGFNGDLCGEWILYYYD